MRGRIDGLLCIEIGLNLAEDYDLIFYAELRDEQALQCFQQHPLHAAHRERCKDLVTARLCGDESGYELKASCAKVRRKAVQMWSFSACFCRNDMV